MARDNIYGYVGGNPVSHIDPLGLFDPIGAGMNMSGAERMGYAAQQNNFNTLGMDQTSSGWGNTMQLVLPIFLEISLTTNTSGQSLYVGVRAPGLSFSDTTNYSCKAGSISGPTVKGSGSIGWGVGVSGSVAVSTNGSDSLGLQGNLGLVGRTGGVWGINPPSPSIGWTWKLN